MHTLVPEVWGLWEDSDVIQAKKSTEERRTHDWTYAVGKSDGRRQLSAFGSSPVRHAGMSDSGGQRGRCLMTQR